MSLETFFKEMRVVTNGRLTRHQVKNTKLIISEWKRNYSGYRSECLAYLLATTYHETAGTMKPLKEYGGKNRANRLYGIEGKNPTRARLMGNTRPGDGARYMGRGFVQLTWKNNYRKAALHTGEQLLKKPHLAKRPDLATKILIEGCMSGWFTTRPLTKYINENGVDYVGARWVVNGTDKAKLIAGYAEEFHEAIEAAGGVEALDTRSNREKVAELREAGSRTIKNADQQEAMGATKIVVGTGYGLYKLQNLISKFEGIVQLGKSIKEVMTSSTLLIEWALSSLPLLFIAGGLYLLWNARKAKAIRVEDEQKIGRLADGNA